MLLQARRDTIWLALALALALTLGVFALATTARGEDPGPVAITAGGADWGLKKSFRDYIEGSIASGSIDVSDGATRNLDGSFHFPLLSGSYDPASKATVARFAGAVHFSGHGGELDMNLTDLALEITPEGAGLFADVVSKSLSDGGLVSYPNVNLATLELGGVEPEIADPTTTWAAVPTTLTQAGVPAFASFYTPGQALDAFDFSYEGPGGKPTPETWTTPGTPGYEQLAGEATGNGTWAMFPDRGRGLLHAISGAGLRALDLETLAQQGAKTAAAALPQNNYAFDPEHGTVFAVPNTTAAGPIRAFTWNDGTDTYDEEALAISGTKTTLLAYEPDDDTLYAIEGTGFPAVDETSTLSPTVAVAVRDGSGWTTPSYPSLVTGGRGVSGLARTSDGRLVATRHAYYKGTLAPANIYPTAAVELTDTGSALTVTEIPGTVPPVQSAYTYGYSQPQAGPGGTVTLSENAPLAPTAHAITLTPQPGGFTTSTPLDIGQGGGIVAIDGVDGTGYALKPQSKFAAVISGGAVVGKITTPPEGLTEFAPTRAAASEGVFYFHNNVSPSRVYAYEHTADSPTIVSDPADAAAVLADEAASTDVSFTATASADPEPAVRWQVREPGAGVWIDVPGAEATTLAVTATAAAAGSRYRAVFSNSAGAIATATATLSVQVVPETPEPPISGGGGESPPAKATPIPAAALPPAPGPAAVKPRLKPATTAARTVGASGVAALATVTCSPPLPCTVTAPKRTRVRIGGSAYWARVLAPKALMAGRSATVRVQLPPPARAALAGGQAQASVRVVVSSGERSLVRKLTATILGGGA